MGEVEIDVQNQRMKSVVMDLFWDVESEFQWELKSGYVRKKEKNRSLLI